MRCLKVFLGYVEMFERYGIYFDFLILLPAVEITKFQIGANVKQGTYTSSSSTVAAVPGFMISLVLLLCNASH